MKKSLIGKILKATGLMCFLCSCGSGENEIPINPNEITEWTEEVDFSKTPDSAIWGTADGWTNGGMFNCGWKRNHITYSNNNMTIMLDNTQSNGKPYTSGEFRSVKTYSYGYYEVTMKPCKASGTNSSFFLFTNKPVWDEIDIEFLGKDTRKVQFNYFVNGKGEHEYLYDLGFDASLKFHKYGIEYLEDKINWYVDGKKVYTAKTGPLPSHPMQVMANFWPGIGMDHWLGSFSYSKPLYAYYDCIRFLEY